MSTNNDLTIVVDMITQIKTGLSNDHQTLQGNISEVWQKVNQLEVIVKNIDAKFDTLMITFQSLGAFMEVNKPALQGLMANVVKATKEQVDAQKEVK